MHVGTGQSRSKRIQIWIVAKVVITSLLRGSLCRPLFNTRVTPAKESTFLRLSCPPCSPRRVFQFSRVHENDRAAATVRSRKVDLSGGSGSEHLTRMEILLLSSPSAENAIRFKSPGKLSGDGRTLIENVAATDGRPDREEARWMGRMAAGGGRCPFKRQMNIRLNPRKAPPTPPFLIPALPFALPTYLVSDGRTIE